MRLKECKAIALFVSLAAATSLFVHLALGGSIIVRKPVERLDTEPIEEKLIANTQQAPKVNSTTEIVTEDLGKEKSTQKKS